jgi:hypothetical protein
MADTRCQRHQSQDKKLSSSPLSTNQQKANIKESNKNSVATKEVVTTSEEEKPPPVEPEAEIPSPSDVNIDKNISMEEKNGEVPIEESAGVETSAIKDETKENDEHENENENEEEQENVNNQNNTVSSTQKSQLIPHTEIEVCVPSTLKAEHVLSPSEKLKRLDWSIRDALIEKQKIICDIFRIPHEHFHLIADIAAQPEAPQELSDLVIAAIAQTQQLTDILNSHINNTAYQETSTVAKSLCNNCLGQQNLHLINDNLLPSTKPITTNTTYQQDESLENVYVDIESVRFVYKFEFSLILNLMNFVLDLNKQQTLFPKLRRMSLTIPKR